MILITIGGVLLFLALLGTNWFVAGLGIVLVVAGMVEIILSS